MSKADKLGASASFARAQPVSSRRAAIAAATGVPTEGVAPPSEAGVETLAHNPFNVREELTGIEETAESLKVKGQLQPLAVATRGAFLAAHPDQQEAIGQAKYVVIDGNRRLASAHLAGLTTLQIYVNDSLAASAEDILESALIANIHRVDVPPMDQAKAVQKLLDKHGTQEQVARRLGKSGAWVSQRLALLELPEDLQEKVESGDLKVKDGRRIGRLPAEQQHTEAEKALNRVKAPRKPKTTPAPTPVEETSPAGSTVAVADASVPAQAAASARALNPVKTSTTAPEAPGVAALPWEDPMWFDRELRRRMSAENREKLVWLLQAEDGV